LKSALLSSVREQNRMFYSTAVAMAQKIEIEGTSLVFTFAPVHKTLRGQVEAKRAWLEQLAHAIAGRKISVVVRESEAVPVPAASASSSGNPRKDDLKARAEAEPTVQAVLDILGGNIEDVEEIE
jgi:hypothetical protein